MEPRGRTVMRDQLSRLFFPCKVNMCFLCEPDVLQLQKEGQNVLPNIAVISFQMALLDEDIAFHSNIPAPLDTMVAVVYSIFGE